ncbi:MAG: nucleotidyltransferase family protein [Candidatus Omnitrophica bacterium]|nr:nucleotidyltransferase family protein [Candidatus Omnitrophota bacterium]
MREFQKQKVKYVIVGGLAMNLLGTYRSTTDLDILIEMSDANLAKVVKILKAKGYVVKQPVDPMGIAQKSIREDWIKNKNMRAFNFYKDQEMKEVDLIIESPVSYQEAQADSIKIKVEDMKLPVISVNHLIKMKKVSGRPIDQWDIDALKKLRKLRA